MQKEKIVLPKLGFKGTLRWAWRQITSMKIALFLLLFLAIAAVPGSIFPQRPNDMNAVETYLQNKPTLGPILDRLQMFDVYASVWFSAIYLLLFVSLIGCIIPRCKKYYQHVRNKPPRTPKNLKKFPQYKTVTITNGTQNLFQLVELGAKIVKSKKYRLEVRDLNTTSPSIGAEKGYLKEVGNLIFHTSLIGILVAVAIGNTYGFRGQKILVENQTFVNSLLDYDYFSPGPRFNAKSLSNYSIRLDKFVASFDTNPSHLGQPLDFVADMTVTDPKFGIETSQTLKVNSPISVGGTQIYLVGNGYAPKITVYDGNGEVAFSQTVVFRPQDVMYTSLGVIKVPDAKPYQLAFEGFLLPTAKITEDNVSFSAFPGLVNPILNLNSYYGDLGLDSGKVESVYFLDAESLTALNSRDLPAGGIALAPGQIYDLPDNKGSIQFDGVYRYVAIDIHHDPGSMLVLVFALLALFGLSLALFVPRRRVWLRLNMTDVGVDVEVAGLARGEDTFLEKEVLQLMEMFVEQTNMGEKNGGN